MPYLVNMFAFSLLCDLWWYITMKPDVAIATLTFLHSVKIACMIMAGQNEFSLSRLFFACPLPWVWFHFLHLWSLSYYFIAQLNDCNCINWLRRLRFFFAPISLFLLFCLPSLSFSHSFPRIFFFLILCFQIFHSWKRWYKEWGGHATHNSRSKKAQCRSQVEPGSACLA